MRGHADVEQLIARTISPAINEINQILIAQIAELQRRGEFPTMNFATAVPLSRRVPDVYHFVTEPGIDLVPADSVDDPGVVLTPEGLFGTVSRRVHSSASDDLEPTAPFIVPDFGRTVTLIRYLNYGRMASRLLDNMLRTSTPARV